MGTCCVMMENGVFRDYVVSALEMAGFLCTASPEMNAPLICSDEWIPEIPDGMRVLVLYRRERYTRSPSYAALSGRCECRALGRPFLLEELIRTIREMTGDPDSGIPVPEEVPAVREEVLVLSRDAMTASCGTFSVNLTEREFCLLEVLCANAGETVSREILLREAWDGMESRGNVVDVYIGYLRRKLEVKFGKGVILSIRGAGYQLSLGERSALVN